MGITDFFSDVWDTFSHPSPDAEEMGGKSGLASTKTPSSGTDEESASEKEVNRQDVKSGGSDEQGYKPSSGGDDDAAEPEEEEEEETVDPMEQLEKGESLFAYYQFERQRCWRKKLVRFGTRMENHG
jgi:ubiquinol-cytochrome c reductase subunit 6